MSVDEAVAAYIKAWRPKGTKRASKPTAQIRAVQTLALRAEPGTKLAASVALSGALNFLNWRLEREPKLKLGAVDKLLTAELIDAYSADPKGLGNKPVGTRRSQKSLLMHAAGISGEVPAGIEIETAAEQLGLTDVRGVLDGAEPNEADNGEAVVEWEPTGKVKEIIENFVPQKIHPELWAYCAPFVRRCITACRPQERRRTQSWMRVIGYLTAWSAQKELPLRTDTVFAESNVKEFLDTVDRAMEGRTAGSYRSAILAVVRQVEPSMSYADLELPRKRASRHRLDERQWQVTLRWANGRRDVSMRRGSQALTFLCRGAGLSPIEAVRVRVDDFSRHDGLRFITVTGTDGRPRSVVVLPEFEERLMAVRERVRKAGDTYLLGGRGKSAGSESRYEVLTRPRNAENRNFEFDHRGLRNAYILDLLSLGRLDLLSLLESIGFEKPASLDIYVEALREEREAAVAEKAS